MNQLQNLYTRFLHRTKIQSIRIMEEVRNQFAECFVQFNIQFQMFEDSFEHQFNSSNPFDTDLDHQDEPRCAPTKNSSPDYDLTFKKKLTPHLYSKQCLGQMQKKSLFQQKQNQLQEIMQTEVNELVERVEMGKIDIQSVDKMVEEGEDELILNKLSFVHSIVAVKKLRRKLKSAKFTHSILSEKQDKNEEEKHKVFLVGLLIAQLQKKLLIESMKYGLNKRKYLQAQIYFNQNQQSQKSASISEQEVRYESQYSKEKILTLFESIEVIYGKRLYLAFKSLAEEPAYLSQDPSFQISAEQNYSEDVDEDQSQNFQQIDKEERILRILNYIEELRKGMKNFPASKIQILRNYFIQWKIFFLNNMISLIEDDPDLPDQSQYNQQVQLEASVLSQTHTELTETNPLKQQKKTLKELIKFREGCLFINLLRQHYSARKIKQIGNSLYEQSLAKKAFKGIFLNMKAKREEVQIQQYAEQIANKQQGDEILATIFYRNNSVAKVFFSLKNYIKCKKVAQVIHKIALRYGYRHIAFCCQKNMRKEEQIERYLQRKKKFLCFKVFQILKQPTSMGQMYERKLYQFRMKKQFEIKEFYFSVLSLEVKKNMVKGRKVDRYYSSKLCEKYFQLLKNVTHEQKLERKYENNLRQFSHYLMRKNYMKKFVNNYLHLLNKKKTQIKQEKLSLLIWKRRIKNGLNGWRGHTLHVKSYQAIEMRLIKLKERERKQKMWRIWEERMREEKERSIRFKGETQNSHRNWLHNYYSNLCLLEK